MQIHDSLAALEHCRAGFPIWGRLREAITASSSHAVGQMHSLGDAITFLRTPRRHRGDAFVAHRRYVEIVAAAGSPVLLEVAPIADLVVTTPYCDLSDRELLAGAGERVRLEPGQIAVLELQEAIRYPEEAAEAPTVLHVSVERFPAAAA
ncbi:hypothetical protein [Brachybacterium hainanense]|uniref:DUF386 domain-containing protein n=1 Tax=Brachybacterium hainanense TaxID=1541174 RepID=A0ABV6RD84_9MICO